MNAEELMTDAERWLISRLEAAEATCQSLRDQSSRWEAQALEAGVRIVELETRIKNLWERECYDDKTVFVCQDGSGAICVSYWDKLETTVARCAELEAQVRGLREIADQWDADKETLLRGWFAAALIRAALAEPLEGKGGSR